MSQQRSIEQGRNTPNWEEIAAHNAEALANAEPRDDYHEDCWYDEKEAEKTRRKTKRQYRRYKRLQGAEKYVQWLYEGKAREQKLYTLKTLTERLFADPSERDFKIIKTAVETIYKKCANKQDIEWASRPIELDSD